MEGWGWGGIEEEEEEEEEEGGGSKGGQRAAEGQRRELKRVCFKRGGIHSSHPLIKHRCRSPPSFTACLFICHLLTHTHNSHVRTHTMTHTHYSYAQVETLSVSPPVRGRAAGST